ncbi:MAG: FAD-linked oxidase C-terminal domain-containing protein [Myxococcota bacterium]
MTKRSALPLELSDEMIELQRRIKKTFDPKGIMNPGKVFPDG